MKKQNENIGRQYGIVICNNRSRAVSEKEPCEEVAKSPVCDTDGEEHASLCHLLLRKTEKALAYAGPCLVRRVGTRPARGCDPGRKRFVSSEI